MTLKIKNTEGKGKDIIELQDIDGEIIVKINGETRVSFCDDGDFIFWGNKADKEFEGRWKE